MFFVGVDGCRGGWLAIRIGEDGGFDAAVLPDIVALWKAYPDAALILIDIPIGLRDEGADERPVDLAARKLIGARRSSLFPCPCRPAVYAGSYPEAARLNREKTGNGLSRENWNIIPKIRQAETFLLSNSKARETICETHPELCFSGLNGGAPLRFYKKKDEGFAERRDILSRLYPSADEVIREAMQKFRRKDAARDDIVDALALAVTAFRGYGKLVSPAPEETDALGLPMRMLYYPAGESRYCLEACAGPPRQ